MPAASPSNQWTGKTPESPEVRPAYLVFSGGAYMFSDTGPSTASLVYDSGPNTLQIDADPNAALAVDIAVNSVNHILPF